MNAPIVRTESNALPKETSAEWFESHDGVRLRLMHFGGSGERGTALIVPGWTEPCEKYAEVALDLIDRGFSVTTFDPRGQGLSARHTLGEDRARIDDFSKHINDLDVIVPHLKPERLTIVAHSMGGLITLSWLARGGRADCAVLSAPATRLFANPAARAGARGLAWLLCKIGQQDMLMGKDGGGATTFEGNNLTSDPDRHKMLHDLAFAGEGLDLPRPYPAFIGAMQAQQAVLDTNEGLANLSVPVLIVGAGADQIVDQTHYAGLSARSPRIDHIEVAGSEHEILMERDELRDQFWDGFDAHTAQYLPQLSAAST
ncbi:MAG: alpha/beta hydrolase [Pseudomonadota bacterium]